MDTKKSSVDNAGERKPVKDIHYFSVYILGIFLHTFCLEVVELSHGS